MDLEAFLKEFLSDEIFHAFVMIEDEKIVGIGNVFLRGKVGWLANIIVHKDHRNKGLGFKMTKFLVEFLTSRGCKTQLLIATQLGEAVYKKIGFEKITEYECFDSVVGYDYRPTNHIRKMDRTSLQQLRTFDAEINGEDRSDLIEKYYHDGLGYFNEKNELLGFYLPNFARGLVLSKEEKAGIELLKIKHSEKGRRTLLPLENQTGIDFLSKLGLQQGVRSSKMVLGKKVVWNPKCIYSYASGYCG